MKLRYDKEVDILYIQFSDHPVAESDSDKPGIILDYDSSKNIVGIEVLNASQKMETPLKVEYELA